MNLKISYYYYGAGDNGGRGYTLQMIRSKNKLECKTYQDTEILTSKHLYSLTSRNAWQVYSSHYALLDSTVPEIPGGLFPWKIMSSDGREIKDLGGFVTNKGAESCTEILDKTGNIASITWPLYKSQLRFQGWETIGGIKIPHTIEEFFLNDRPMRPARKWTLLVTAPTNEKVNVNLHVLPGQIVEDLTTPGMVALTFVPPNNLNLASVLAHDTKRPVLLAPRGHGPAIGLAVLAIAFGGATIYFLRKKHDMRMGKSESTKNAFTLVELLIVIAILALLAAILLPVFARARVKGYEASAIEQAGEIGVGQAMYRTDADGTYPLHYVWVGAKLEGWTQLLEPYVHDGPQPSSLEAHPRISRTNSVYFDPIKPIRATALSAFSLGYCLTSWGISTDLARERMSGGVHSMFLPAPGYPLTDSQVLQASSCVDLAETVGPPLFPGSNLPSPGSGDIMAYDDTENGDLPVGVGTQGMIDAPYPTGGRLTVNGHLDYHGYNVTLFCDGHVKAMPVELLTSSDHFWKPN